uniref:BHLH domain-containing protein n=1 Tax=Arion vulgaris TaxID=1028688 RepID=A0A0B6ZFF3_9EUPU
MVTMTSYRHYGVSAAQVVARRQVRMHLRKIREREYSKLRALVPSVASKQKVTKVQVIEEAVRYIEELHATLLERFRQKHGNMAEDKAQETVRTFVSRMMTQTSSTNLPDHHNDNIPPLVRHSPSTFEKQKSQPSFLLRKRRKI